MCQICHQFICPPSCPNAEYTVHRIGRCARCREDILEGEEAISIEGVLYHTECLEDMTLEELLEEIGIDFEIIEGR